MSESINPNATAEEVLQLPVLEALAHPNCPSDLWWRLAKDLPMEAEASLLFPLLTLEEPDRWEETVHDNLERWLRTGQQRLAISQQHLFVADCAERALPFFERKWVYEKRPRKAIQMRRLFARGEATEEQLKEAKQDAKMMRNHAESVRTRKHQDDYDEVRAYTENAAIFAATASHGTLDEISRDAASAFFYDGERTGKGNAAWDVERRWQWKRLQQYLRGEI